MPPNPSTMCAQWQSTHGGYAPRFFEPVLRAAFAHLEPGLEPGSMVVDVGSGRGQVTAALGALGCQATGLDVHLPTLRQGRLEHPGVPFFAADAEHLPLADGSAAALFSFSVLQYVNRARALAECSRVLKPGGRFAIVENLRWNPVSLAYRLRKRLTGRGYPDHLRPRAHLEWRARRQYEAWFTHVQYEPFYLLSPLLLSGEATWAEMQAPDSLRGRLFRRLVAAERQLLRAVPPARAGCWILLVTGTR